MKQWLFVFAVTFEVIVLMTGLATMVGYIKAGRFLEFYQMDAPPEDWWLPYAHLVAIGYIVWAITSSHRKRNQAPPSGS